MPNLVAQLLDRLASTVAALREVLSSKEAPVDVAPGKKASRRRPKGPTAAAPPEAHKQSKPPSSRLALQGKYMSAIRGLSDANKAKVKKVLVADGVEAAIAMALSKKKG